MQRDIGPRPGILRRRQVVGVDLARHLEHGDGDFFRHLRPRREPLRRRPGIQNRPRMGISLCGLGLDIVKGIEDEQRVRQRLGGDRRKRRIVQQVDQRSHVVTAQHGAQQFRRPSRCQNR